MTDADTSTSAHDRRDTILVADDDRLIVATIGGALRAAGFKVLEAFDCATALDACLRLEPALALIDYKMPDSSGIHLARQITARTDVPVIFLTAYGNDAIVGEAIAAGAMAYLVKPIDPSQIIPVVRVALRRSQELRALQAQAARLSAAVQSGKQIGIATGLVMANLKLDQHEAFERLRRHARSRRTRVEELAGDLLRIADESGGLYIAMSAAGPARATSDKDAADSGK